MSEVFKDSFKLSFIMNQAFYIGWTITVSHHISCNVTKVQPSVNLNYVLMHEGSDMSLCMMIQ